MFEPKKIYEGLDTVLRNIMPGIIILWPLYPFMNDINKYSIIAIVILMYLIISTFVISIYESIGYLYLTLEKLHIPVKPATYSGRNFTTFKNSQNQKLLFFRWQVLSRII